MARFISGWLLAAFFILAGANHFIHPTIYLPMMPPWLPSHSALIAISGGAEIVGGLAILAPATRVFGGWWLIALLVAIFPANVQMALDGHPAWKVAPWILWARLPMQGVLIWWVYWMAIQEPKRDAKGGA
jgi:uncharacterized membrane protein